MRYDARNMDKLQEKIEGGGVQVIARAAQIMRTLQKHPQGMTRTQLAREVNLARSTVHRIVGALIEERTLFRKRSTPISGCSEQ